VPLAFLLALELLLACGRADLPAALRLPLGVAALALAALPQGMLLPLCVRAREERAGAAGRVALPWLASLAGSAAGAWLFAGQVVAAYGRTAAVAAAGSAGLAAALIAALCARGGAPAPAAPQAERASAPALSPRAAALLVGVATAWMVGLEALALRLGVLWLGGMQDALAAVLAASLIALAAGAALAPLLPPGRAGVALVLGLAALGSAWPLCAAPALAAVRGGGPLPLALVLAGPPLLPFGALVPAVFRAASGGRAGEGRRLGGLLLHEAWGAALGGPLLALAIPAVGLTGALALLTAAGAAAALLLGRAGLAPAAAAAAACAAALLAPAPARASPPLSNPAFEIVAFEEDADFAVSVVDDGQLGERTLLTDGFRAAGDGRDYRYMRLLGHLPLLLHPAPRSVCVLALGTGTTLGAAALHPEVAELEVLELSPAVVRQARHFTAVNGGALDDARVRVALGDGRHTLAARRAAYDVITLEPLLPDSPFAVYLYTREFYAAARRALRSGGLVCQWVPPHALEPAVFEAVVGAFADSFPDASLWLFDTQLLLVGAEQPPALAPERFPAGGPLHDALAALGAGDPAHLAAHRVGGGAAWPRPARSLTDADPWIIYRPRRRGPELLADLPRNLRALAAIESPPAAAGATAAELWSGQRALARARAAHAWDEAVARGASCDEPLRPSAAAELEEAARRLGRDDPALRAFAEELRFLDALRDGVARLSAGDARAAVPELVTAAELRPERGDVHLYLSAALQEVGAGDGARAAWKAAHERCPRILQTSAGARVLALGFAEPR
jgi:spermidine synthase